MKGKKGIFNGSFATYTRNYRNFLDFRGPKVVKGEFTYDRCLEFMKKWFRGF